MNYEAKYRPEADIWVVIDTCTNKEIAAMETEEDAERVRACLDACDGIPTEALDAGYVKALEESHADMSEALHHDSDDDGSLAHITREARRVQAMREATSE